MIISLELIVSSMMDESYLQNSASNALEFDCIAGGEKGRKLATSAEVG